MQKLKFDTKPEALAHAEFLQTLGFTCKVYKGHRAYAVSYWRLEDTTDALIGRLAAQRAQLEQWVERLETHKLAQPKDLIRRGPAP